MSKKELNILIEDVRDCLFNKNIKNHSIMILKLNNGYRIRVFNRETESDDFIVEGKTKEAALKSLLILLNEQSGI